MFSQFKNICIIGFGASSLNVRALMSSINHCNKKLYYLDSLDPLIVSDMLRIIEPSATAFVVISKSGNTQETNILFNFLVQNHCFNDTNLFIICSCGDSETQKIAQNIKHIWITYPPAESGRFSLLEKPFLDIVQAMGVDSKSIVRSSNSVQDIAAQNLASRWTKNFQNGNRSWVIMSYSTQLNGLFLWIRQIVSESLGKNTFGITPILAEGSMDEHSQLQLFLDGPNDKFYDIISSDFIGYDPTLSRIQVEHAHMVTNMLKDKQRDVNHIHHNKIDESTIGYYIGLYMKVIIIIANNMGFNPYSQPAVENIKQKSNEI